MYNNTYPQPPPRAHPPPGPDPRLRPHHPLPPLHLPHRPRPHGGAAGGRLSAGGGTDCSKTGIEYFSSAYKLAPALEEADGLGAEGLIKLILIIVVIDIAFLHGGSL